MSWIDLKSIGVPIGPRLTRSYLESQDFVALPLLKKSKPARKRWVWRLSVKEVWELTRAEYFLRTFCDLPFLRTTFGIVVGLPLLQVAWMGIIGGWFKFGQVEQ